MVPKDNSYTNVNVVNRLIVRESISVPNIVVLQSIVLGENATIIKESSSENGQGSNVVFTSGDQTISGVKTFVDTPIFLNSFGFSSLTLADTSNQLEFGTGQTVTLNVPTPTSSRIYTVPDVGADADFVMTQGTQTIAGSKTFSSVLSLTSFGTQLRLANGSAANVIAIGVVGFPSAARTYFLPDVGANANFVLTQGAQTIAGTKTFSDLVVFSGGFSGSASVLTSTGGSVVLGTGNTVTVSRVTPAAPRTYSLQEVGADANFIMSQGIQSISGAKTFASAISISPTTNQLVLGNVGVGQTITINAPAPGANRVYSVPDASADANFVLSEGTQTVNGAKTLTNLLLPTTGGTPTALTYNEELQTTIAFTGPSTTSPNTVDVHLSRVGNIVTLSVAQLLVTGTGVAGKFVSSAGAIPTRFCPKNNGAGYILRAMHLEIRDTSQFMQGGMIVNGSNGIIQISRSTVSTTDLRTDINFTATGGVGWSPFTCSWST